MSSWDGKSQAGLLGYKIFIATLRYGGISSAYLLLRFVALYYFLLSRKSNIPIENYFRQKLGLSWWQATKARYQNYYVFGQTLIDRVAMMSGLVDRYTFDFEGEDYLHQLVAEGKGGLLISAHVGNWEIAGHLLKRIKTKVNVVMHEAEHEKVKQFLDKAKGKNTMDVIVIKEDLSHVYDMSLALQRGELICMHGDRFMPWAKTITLPFLGQEAPFPQGPFATAIGFKVPVCYVFAMKEGNWHYQFSSTKPKVYQVSRGENKDAKMHEALLDFITETERIIRTYPVQWFNYYDFWTMSTGVPLIHDQVTQTETLSI
jgi:predicted LPLAT superfamily acyltransferase